MSGPSETPLPTLAELLAQKVALDQLIIDTQRAERERAAAAGEHDHQNRAGAKNQSRNIHGHTS